eukprot:Nitzschia sp. Nitz4//scaffold13_size275219//143510//144685//NITZ4_000878-RA/size275219-processed-gene-0.146-mRNA-1//-1//CDS//3329536026//2174//frame0
MSFNRPPSAFRNAFGQGEFPFQANRYILYLSHACPWANGVLQAAVLRGLVWNENPEDDMMKVCVAHPTWQFTAARKDREAREADEASGKPQGFVAAAGVATKSLHAGWVFAAPGQPVLPIAVMQNGGDFGLEIPGTIEQIHEGEVTISDEILANHGIVSNHCTEDISKFKAKNVREFYAKCGGLIENGVRATTPFIFDTHTDRIVNNESTEILQAINQWATPTNSEKAVDLYPADLKDDVLDKIDWVYAINNGVYRCGFASAQKDYEEAAAALEARMQEVEEHLSKNRYLCGDTFTAADLRLFNTMVRMDEVYVVYFKCAFASILNGDKYPNLLKHTARVYHSHNGAIKKCIFMDDIRHHYFTSHAIRNMYGIVSKSVGFLDKLESMKDSC